jgi:two-component system, OmpR family, KDP operon response regulator KdpE
VTTILAVDDEPQILRALRTSLTGHGYTMLDAGTGEEALAVAAVSRPDLVVLDLGLPDIDGADVITQLRGWSQVPVIVLSVRDDQAGKVGALDAGADDYLTKPFGMDELLARIRAALRRSAPTSSGSSTLGFGDLRMDLEKRLVTLEGRPVHLTPTEYDVLVALATNPGKLLTHAWLLKRVWGPRYGDESHYLRVYVRQLRQKLRDDAAAPSYILTEPAVGYRWLPEPD